MKTNSIILFLVAIILSFFFILNNGCKKEDEEEIINERPNIEIILVSTEYTWGESIFIKVEGEDPDGNLKYAKLFIDDIKLFSSSSLPFTYSLETNNLTTSEQHKIRVYAMDEMDLEGYDYESFNLLSVEPEVSISEIKNITDTSTTCVINISYGSEPIESLRLNYGLHIKSSGELSYYHSKSIETSRDINTYEIDVELVPNCKWYFQANIKMVGFEVIQSKIDSIKTLYYNKGEGTFTDTRDGKQYRWVKIGNQTWMAENLAYIPEVGPPDSDVGICVYDYWGTSTYEAKNTDAYKEFGCLYNYRFINQLAPSGWHIPTSEEIHDEFLVYIENTTEKFARIIPLDESDAIKQYSNYCNNYSWINNYAEYVNIFNFSAKPSGSALHWSNSVWGSMGYHWQCGSTSFWYSDRHFGVTENSIFYNGDVKNDDGYSYRFHAIRCIKD